MKVGTGSPTIKSACRRASISCGLSWTPTLHRAAFILHVRRPVGLETEQFEDIRNAGGGEGAGEQVNPCRNPDVSPSAQMRLKTWVHPIPWGIITSGKEQRLLCVGTC